MRRITTSSWTASFFYYGSIKIGILNSHYITQFELLATTQDTDLTVQALQRLLLTEWTDSSFLYFKNFNGNFFLGV